MSEGGAHTDEIDWEQRMARKREVTEASSRYLPAAEVPTRARTQEHGVSQARKKRPIRAFLGSLAEGALLHERSLAEGEEQATK